jgi:hypothetical protein
MSVYVRNKLCPCARCRTRGLLGAAILITLGILFLLHNLTSIDFGDSWPALLIVIGAFTYLGRAASTEGHVPPYYAAPVGTAPPPPYPAPGAPEQHPDPTNTQVNP